ncbi:hypothetical protein NEUTE1DRAFT_141894 [Neurospora tetrasperma FGSC 2508]|uniref:Uncharacterized protein n=1 Tax=Neurospora tetrasperma (strain FGSC 2508 / ATCC MYA-4615 / P0657) TaxID=510951 RepID=F8MZ95_NEUT8|nr:uncharacterized protein NEUTE1DRAFT_141894 [Neurospora tetrasperma FGSC 2508]EGO51986.1 hypothetical protein NEUTE1DRAFT_141894 [Neurospora tetrasperma FGSC 2508]
MLPLGLNCLSPSQTAGRPIGGAYEKALDRMSDHNRNPSRYLYSPGEDKFSKLMFFLHASNQSSFARFYADKDHTRVTASFIFKAQGTTSSRYSSEKVLGNSTREGIAQLSHHLTTFILRRNPRAVHLDARQSNSREPRRNGPYPSPQHLLYEFRFQDKPRSQAAPKASLRKSDTFSHDLILIGKLVSLGTMQGKLLGNLPHAVSNVNAADTNNAPASTNNRTKRKSAPTSAKKLAVDDSYNDGDDTVVYEDTGADEDNAGGDEDAVYKFECSHRY